MTGYLAHELIGWTPGAVLQGPDTNPQTVAQLSRAIRAGRPIRCEILNYTKSGEPYWIDMSIAPLHGVDGGLEKFIAVERDISAAKHRALELEDAKAAAERAEQRLSAAIAAMADGFSIYDASDRLVMANAAFYNFRAEDAELLAPGVSFDEMVRHGLRLGYFDTEGLSDDEWVALQMASRQRDSGETVVKFADGRWMLRRDRRTPQGELISIRTDVTALKRHEQELSEARERAEAADRAKSDFVAMISHEIRTPISGIIGLNQMMLADDLSPAQRERAEIVRDSSEHLLQLAGNVLDLSAIASDNRQLQSEVFALDDLVSGTVSSVSTLADEKGLTLSVCSMAPGRRVIGDPGAVKQILTNLIGNGIKFTAQGSVTLALSDRDGGILFEIADTGAGIPEDKLAVIFQRFAQLGGRADRAQGTGLGLSITKRLVEMMNGRIGVTSEPGRGSVFSAWLPLPCETGAGEAARLERDRAGREAKAEKTARMFDILVAEDHPVNQRLICEILRSIGCRVSMAENGQQALDQLDAADFDLIIMDNQMPVMTGMEAIGVIRARPDWKMRTPIIALTANAMRGAEKAYKALGVDAFITKPLNVQKVLDAVRRLAEAGRKLRDEARSGAI